MNIIGRTIANAAVFLAATAGLAKKADAQNQFDPTLYGNRTNQTLRYQSNQGYVDVQPGQAAMIGRYGNYYGTTHVPFGKQYYGFSLVGGVPKPIFIDAPQQIQQFIPQQTFPLQQPQQMIRVQPTNPIQQIIPQRNIPRVRPVNPNTIQRRQQTGKNIFPRKPGESDDDYLRRINERIKFIQERIRMLERNQGTGSNTRTTNISQSTIVDTSFYGSRRIDWSSEYPSMANGTKVHLTSDRMPSSSKSGEKLLLPLLTPDGRFLSLGGGSFTAMQVDPSVNNVIRPEYMSSSWDSDVSVFTPSDQFTLVEHKLDQNLIVAIGGGDYVSGVLTSSDYRNNFRAEVLCLTMREFCATMIENKGNISPDLAFIRATKSVTGTSEPGNPFPSIPQFRVGADNSPNTNEPFEVIFVHGGPIKKEMFRLCTGGFCRLVTSNSHDAMYAEIIEAQQVLIERAIRLSYGNKCLGVKTLPQPSEREFRNALVDDGIPKKVFYIGHGEVKGIDSNVARNHPQQVMANGSRNLALVINNRWAGARDLLVPEATLKSAINDGGTASAFFVTCFGGAGVE